MWKVISTIQLISCYTPPPTQHHSFIRNLLPQIMKHSRRTPSLLTYMRVNSGPSAKESDMDLQKMKRFCENLSEPLSLFFFYLKWNGTMGPMEVTRVFLLSVILVCFLTSGSSFTYKCKWRSPANVRPKHFWHLYLNESHSLALETTFSPHHVCNSMKLLKLAYCGDVVHWFNMWNLETQCCLR